MGGRHSRTKGHQFERDTANTFKEFFPKARRQLEYHEDDCRGVDIQHTGKLAIQCKRYKGYVPINKIEEIQLKNKINLLITKADKKDTMVVLKLHDFLEILRDNNYIYETNKDMDRSLQSD